MSEWIERIRGHGAWAVMRSLGTIIDQAIAMEGIDPQAVVALERIRTILAFCGKRLAGADPLVVVPGLLDNIGGSFSNSRAEIEAFLSDRNNARLQSANALADNALVNAGQIPVAFSPEELGSLVSATNDYRNQFEKGLVTARDSTDAARADVENLRAKVAEVATSVQNEQQRLAQVTADYQRQFSEAQEKRNQEYSETLRQAQQHLASVTSEQQGQFSSAQDTRSREFAEAQTVRQGDFNKLHTDFTQRLTDQNADFTRQREELIRKFDETLTGLNVGYAHKAEDILKSIEQHERHVEELVGVIGNLGVTSGYLRAANHARWSMWIWQATTLLAMVFLSLLAYRTLPLLEDQSGHLNWFGFGGRIALLASLGVIAAYAAAQADKQFDMERRNRKLALELEAIGPYLAPLSQEEQDKFRIEIGGRTFGREEAISDRHYKSPATILQLLLSSKEGKQIIELLSGLLKRADATKD
jgi:hypothetical protein